jgi:hypothetical protein
MQQRAQIKGDKCQSNTMKEKCFDCRAKLQQVSKDAARKNKMAKMLQ